MSAQSLIFTYLAYFIKNNTALHRLILIVFRYLQSNGKE